MCNSQLWWLTPAAEEAQVYMYRWNFSSVGPEHQKVLCLD